MVVDSNVPIVAERAMYSATAGSGTAGTSPQASRSRRRVVPAEGETGPFFDTSSWSPTRTRGGHRHVDVLTDQASRLAQLHVQANAGLTVTWSSRARCRQRRGVDHDHRQQPIIVERAMYWRATAWSGARRTTASASPRRAEVGPGGRAVGTDRRLRPTSCWPTRAPPRRRRCASLPADERHHLVRTHGQSDVALQHRREHAGAELVNESFGALIEVTNGSGSGRALVYNNALGQVWAAGTNAPARASRND